MSAMATYVRVNLKDKRNNIIYPNISNQIDITNEGTVVFRGINQGIEFPSVDGTIRHLSIKEYNINGFAGEGEWTYSFRYYNNDGSSVLGRIGAYGEDEELQYYYFGQWQNPLLKTTANGDCSVANSFRIPKNPKDGCGLANTDGISIIRDYNNQNVTVCATGEALYLGYTTTKQIRICKVTIPDTNGNIDLGTSNSRFQNLFLSNILNTSKTTTTFLAGNQGNAIINSTAGAGSYTMLAKMNSTNGVFTIGTYQDNFELHYTANSTISANTNSVTKTVYLLNENGNSSFPGGVTSSWFTPTRTSTLTDGIGIISGGDGANNTTANIKIQSWFGIGFSPTITGQKIPQGENAVYIDVRNGNLVARGTVTATAFNGNASTATTLSDSHSFVWSGARQNVLLHEDWLRLHSFAGSVYTSDGSKWYSVINVRHRGGGGDGNNYGWQLINPFGSSWIQHRSQSNGKWTSWYTIPCSVDNGIINIRSGAIATWNANYANYGTHTIFFAW